MIFGAEVLRIARHVSSNKIAVRRLGKAPSISRCNFFCPEESAYS